MFSAATKTDNVSSAANYIEDVFSTYLYTGTGAAQSINNGIALGNSAANNSSISLNAATPSYLTFSSQVNLSGDFCIQAWVYPTSLTGTRLLFSSTSDTNVQIPRIQENGGIYCYANGTEITSGSAASALQANVWTHLAMTRSGSTFRIFVNGVLYTTATYSGTFNINVLGVFFFNGSLFGTPYAFGGNISNAQIVTGSAIYTTDFTPPQNTLIGGAVLLGAGATPLADTSGTGKTVTQFGSPTASSTGPWAVGGNYGGLVWNKLRNNGTAYHYWVDTVRGRSSGIGSNSTDAQYISSAGNDLVSFNTTGYTVGPVQNWNASNINGGTIVSWTFREQAKFFDVVTYTGTGPGTGANEQQVSHNLGSKPGAVIIKRTDSTGDWWFFTDVIDGTNDFGYLNRTDAFGNSGNNVPTSTVFNVGGVLNTSGATYVAYLFANNAGGFGAAGTDNVISCGSWVNTGSNVTVNLGYEPQYIMMKASGTTSDWYVWDTMRGLVVDGNSGTGDKALYPNLSSAEVGTFGIEPTATGFIASGGWTSTTWIYIAIRRGPMRPPTTGTSVFSPVARTGTGAIANVNCGFAPDMVGMAEYPAAIQTGQKGFTDKLRGGTRIVYSSNTTGELGAGDITQFQNNGVTLRASGGDYNVLNALYINWFFQRAPSFFDIVCYTGTGSNTTQTHNLAVVPELILVKGRSASTAWQVYSSALANTEYLVLNTTAAKATGATRWNSTTPTSSVFSLGTASEVNTSAATYMAYLFASCPGVSKVGSYTGTGATQVVNCGFAAGSRFVLIKATSTTGDWYVWDSARGIVAGNDPYLAINTTNAEVTNTDWVDTAATGFELSNAGGNLVNSNGVSYVFLAIA
jgi:hypothetical protein